MNIVAGREAAIANAYLQQNQTTMKASRLIAYGIGGVIAGLLFENGALRLKAKGGAKIRSAKKQAGKKLQEALPKRG